MTVQLIDKSAQAVLEVSDNKLAFVDVFLATPIAVRDGAGAVLQIVKGRAYDPSKVEFRYDPESRSFLIELSQQDQGT